jgi:hypothetical protein
MSARVHLATATLLAIMLVSVAAAPTSAAVERVPSAERLAHRLIDCLRTGGKVTLHGRCRGYGSGRYSRERKPLELSRRISREVSWPWARRLSSADSCTHQMGRRTSLDWRFRSAGLRHDVNGENVACSSGKHPRAMVAYWVRYWWRERSYGGAHWYQIKDRDFRSVGIAVSRTSGGRTRLVVNFYGRSIR